MNLFYHKLREVIFSRLAHGVSYFSGGVDVDESYFGVVGKGKRGRGSAGKVPVFGLLKRDGDGALARHLFALPQGATQPHPRLLHP